MKKGRKGATGRKLGKIILMMICFVGLAALFGIIIFGNGIDISKEAETGYNQIDDQRGTLWPILVSLIATLLGSVITAYVFLKQALDRKADERAYYEVVINEYRNRIMRRLFICSTGALSMIGAIIFVYIKFYFQDMRVCGCIRLVLIAIYGICIIGSAMILYMCIDTERGLLREAKRILKRKGEEGEELLKTYSEVVLERICGQVLKGGRVEQWLQIDDANQNGVSRKKFVSRFSEWEKLVVVLIETRECFLNGQSKNERIRTAVLAGEKVFEGENEEIEKRDAEDHRWNRGAYSKIERCQRELDISGERFGDIYSILAEYRDLLQVQMEIESKERVLYIEKDSKTIVDLFFLFVIYVSINVARILPKLEIFFPAGRFRYANFYNTRFENSAFRASFFEDSVFARSKIENSNFGMSFFKNCEFFSTDSRDCSMSNTLIESCGFKETIFSYVDFTGTVFKNCNFEKASFNDSILSNLTIDACAFGENDFVNCKIWNVTISNIRQNQFRQCNFSHSSLEKMEMNFENELPAFPRRGDAFTESYLSFLKGLEPLKNQQGRKEMKIRQKVEKYFAINEKFHEVKVSGGRAQKKRIDSKAIWGIIKKMTAVQLNGCIFTGTVMPEIVFYRTDMGQGVFTDAQMYAVKLINVNMFGCIMERANLRKGVLAGVNMQSVVLDDAILFQACCKVVNFEDASLKNLHASEADMTYCSFNRSDCSNIDLTRADIHNSSFRDSILTRAEFTEADFQKVNFENSIADNMLSSYSYFEQCDMKNAFLKQSSFNYTVFQECDFSLADFSNSTVTNVEFYHCDFLNSNFRNTCFINSCFKDSSHMEPTIFEGCHFITSKFEGNDKELEKLLSNYIINN